MGLEKINDINQPVIILSEQLEPIMQKYFTKEEYEEFLKYKISIDNGCGLYYTADINRFFLVNFDNDFYLSYKLYKQIAKDNVIEQLIEYRRKCKRISDEIGTMEYENIFGEKNKISLFDFSYNLNIPFYEVYFYYDSYGKDCISYFTENEFSKLFKKNLELYMKLFDQEFLINNYKKFYDKIDFIKDLKEKTLFKMILFIESNAKQNINSDTYKFNSIDEFLSLLLLFDDKEIINKDCINIKDEIFIKNIIRDIINNKEISREDLKKIYLITDNKIVSLRINTYLMDALINNNYDFLQEHKSKVINFNSLKKDN